MLIAGPNLAIDRTIAIERFDAGLMHRADRVERGSAAAAVAAAIG